MQTKVIYSSHLQVRVAKLTMTYILAIKYKEYYCSKETITWIQNAFFCTKSFTFLNNTLAIKDWFIDNRKPPPPIKETEKRKERYYKISLNLNKISYMQWIMYTCKEYFNSFEIMKRKPVIFLYRQIVTGYIIKFCPCRQIPWLQSTSPFVWKSRSMRICLVTGVLRVYLKRGNAFNLQWIKSLPLSWS